MPSVQAHEPQQVCQAVLTPLPGDGWDITLGWPTKHIPRAEQGLRFLQIIVGEQLVRAGQGGPRGVSWGSLPAGCHRDEFWLRFHVTQTPRWGCTHSTETPVGAGPQRDQARPGCQCLNLSPHSIPAPFHSEPTLTYITDGCDSSQRTFSFAFYERVQFPVWKQAGNARWCVTTMSQGAAWIQR